MTPCTAKERYITYSSCGDEMEKRHWFTGHSTRATVKMGNQECCNLRWLNAFPWAPDQIKALGKTPFSHPRLVHIPFKLSFLPCSPQMKSLYSRKHQAFHCCLWATRIKELSGCFPLRTGMQGGRKRLLQFRHVLISGDGVRGRGPSWPRNQWESHQFCLSSQQGRALPLERCPPFLFFS